MQTFTSEIRLGDEVKDTVTGFQGVAASITFYMQGCARIGVQPKVKKDGTLPELKGFDEPQLELVTAKKVVNKKPTRGGPARYQVTEKEIISR